MKARQFAGLSAKWKHWPLVQKQGKSFFCSSIVSQTILVIFICIEGTASLGMRIPAGQVQTFTSVLSTPIPKPMLWTKGSRSHWVEARKWPGMQSEEIRRWLEAEPYVSRRSNTSVNTSIIPSGWVLTTENKFKDKTIKNFKMTTLYQTLSMGPFMNALFTRPGTWPFLKQ